MNRLPALLLTLFFVLAFALALHVGIETERGWMPKQISAQQEGN